LRALGIDQSNLPSPDPFVDPVLVSAGGGGYSASLLIVGPLAQKRHASESNARLELSIDPDELHSGQVGAESPASRLQFYTT